jgi:A/G-specific adenine glycosylase
MAENGSGSEPHHPFGRTTATVDELEELIDTSQATRLLEANGVDHPEPRVRRFITTVPDLLEWLESNGRVFPWRKTDEPWRIYISEILLQRTRAEAVEDIYPEFFDRFPDPATLRQAPQTEIKTTIEPLGFGNQRTRSLRDVARILSTDHDNSVPASLEELQRPWRVGPYSARATLIFAFDEPLALVDTNTARVVERVFGYEMPAQPHKSDEVYRLLDALIPWDPELARAVNLALLDLAAAICAPNTPDCPACPLNPGCEFADQSHGCVYT